MDKKLKIGCVSKVHCRAHHMRICMRRYVLRQTVKHHGEKIAVVAVLLLTALLSLDMPPIILALGAILITISTAFILVWQILRLSLPRIDGETEVNGIESSILIKRCTNGIPHITADSEADAAFALGYVHAQDRLWQMDFMRRFGGGCLSEILGKKTLVLDKTMRKLGFHRHAQTSLDAVSDDVKEQLQAYSRGVNEFIRSRRKYQLPPEFLVLRYAPKEWQPEDCLLWSKIMALQLSGSCRKQITRLRLFERLPRDIFQALFPECSLDLDLVASLAPEERAAIEGVFMTLPPPLGPARASNVWVIGAERSATRKPILANDLHLGLQSPIPWYLVRMVVQGAEKVGATIPGVPSLIVGHNSKVAWGVTSAGSDVQDVYTETIDPSDCNRYMSVDGSFAFTTREEIIHIKNAAPVTLIVRETNHGTVLTEFGESDALSHVVSLAHSTALASDTTFEAFHRVNQAESTTQAMAGLEHFVAPPLNFHFADVDGNIGFLSAGHVPIRKEGDASFPLPGNKSRYDWIGTIPFTKLPRSVNPASGLLWNANNQVGGDDYPYLLTRFWAHPFRAKRIRQLVEQSNKISVARCVEMQGDTYSPALDIVKPLLEAIEPKTEAGADMKSRLMAWDGGMARSRTEPLILYQWIRQIGLDVFQEPLREGCADITAENLFIFLQNFDGTVNGRSLQDIASDALEGVAGRLVACYGRELSSVCWGMHHIAALNHTFWQAFPVLRWLFDLSIASDGDPFTLNAGGMPLMAQNKPFRHMHGAAFRVVFDLSNLDNSKYVAATGPSGHPISRFYDVMTEKWQRMEMVSVTENSILPHLLKLNPNTSSSAMDQPHRVESPG